MTDRRHLHAVPDQPDVLDPRFRPPRPDLRRPPRDEPASYVVRAVLDLSTPPIWRTLELRSDQTLARVHRVLQAAFGWTDSHLHRASLARARRLVGLKGYVTNIPTSVMDAGEVIASYHDLWAVEQSFRMSKTDLRARPMFARTRDAMGLLHG